MLLLAMWLCATMSLLFKWPLKGSRDPFQRIQTCGMLGTVWSMQLILGEIISKQHRVVHHSYAGADEKRRVADEVSPWTSPFWFWKSHRFKDETLPRAVQTLREWGNSMRMLLLQVDNHSTHKFSTRSASERALCLVALGSERGSGNRTIFISITRCTLIKLLLSARGSEEESHINPTPRGVPNLLKQTTQEKFSLDPRIED